MADNDNAPEQAADDVDVVEEEEPEDEYNVEAIRAKRRNNRTGLVEYLIKWENYPESQNTWEPQEHLKCPDLICKFHEQEKSKRKRKSVPESQTKRSKINKTEPTCEATTSRHEGPLLVEDNELDNGSSTETLSSTTSYTAENGNENVAEPDVPDPKGFERGLPIERIVGSCTDDNDKLWFFVKWKGSKELELVDANELEEKAPREMCSWYRERLYYTLQNPAVIGH